MTKIALNANDGHVHQLHRPNRPSLATLAYEAIVEAIVDRRLQPGERLAIEALAEQLEMSTTPIREALMRTVVERLVIQDNNRGFTVAPLLSEPAYHQLFEVRHLLETHAIRIKQPDPNTIEMLAQLLGSMAAMKHGPEYRDFRAFSKADTAFHRSLVTLSGNVFLLRSWENLHFHLHVGRLYAGAGVIDFGDALAEHNAILEALRAAEPERMLEVVDHHIRRAEQRLRGLVTVTLAAAQA